MACTYSFGGNLLDCKESAGGIKEIYIVDKSYISGFTIDGTTQKVLTITMAGVNKFKTYQIRRQTASLATTVTTSDTNGTTFFDTQLTFQIPKLSAAKRLELLALAVGNMTVMIRDNNDSYWIIGLNNPVVLTAGSANSGTNFGDANGYSYTLQDINTVAPYEVTKSIIVGVTDSNISLPLPA